MIIQRKSNRGKENSIILIVLKEIHILRLLPLPTCNGDRLGNFDNATSVYMPTVLCKMRKKEKKGITTSRNS